MSGRTTERAGLAARLAWPIASLSIVLAVAGLLLVGLNGGNVLRLFESYWLVDDVQAIVYPLVGALIASRHPSNPIGWLFCGAGLAHGMAAFTGEYAVYSLATNPDIVPGGLLALWIESWVWAPGLLLIPTLLPLLFPHGRLPSHRWRPAVWIAGSGIVVVVASEAVRPWSFGSIPESVPAAVAAANNPFAIAGAGPIVDLLQQVAFGCLVLSGIAALAAAAIQLRRATGEAKEQLKWFAGAIVIVALAVLPLYPTPWGQLLQLVALPVLPVATGIAILKHRLYDVDILINRALVYGALTASVVGLYILVVGSIGALFQVGGDLSVSLIATGLVAVLFAPLRDHLQRAVNRLMYGERDDPYAVLSRLGRRLEQILVPDAVLPMIVQTVRDALKLPYAAIEVKQGDAFAIAAASGAPGDDLLRLPLVYQGEVVGRLSLSPRVGEESFTAADHRLLDDLARQAGIAVEVTRRRDEAFRLAADLQRAREWLVTAREEERRRLRRDLHDGLGPQLASQTLTLDAVRKLVVDDPSAAIRLVDDLKAQTQSALADIRRLVYALRPPALDDLGLIGALREGAAQYAHAGLHVAVDAPENLPPLPAAVEVAAYRIVQEALTNVVRHAQAHTCAVRLVRQDALHVEISDDGCGLFGPNGTPQRAGVGLTSMRERAAELGGTLTIEPRRGGGTCIRASLPLPKEVSWDPSAS